MESKQSKEKSKPEKGITSSLKTDKTSQTRLFKYADRVPFHSKNEVHLDDPYANTYDIPQLTVDKCLYAFHANLEHHSPWQGNHPENPKRSVEIHHMVEKIMVETDRIALFDPSYLVELPDENLLGLVHTHLDQTLIKKACETTDASMFKQWDSVYGNGPKSWENAVLAARVAVSMGKLICQNGFRNGFANIRPPGHHASSDEPNGYCLLNNAAITAEYLIETELAERILIVDFDVHHGQGTQRTFYKSDKVLYFSIHRYEFGKFWPNLRESDFDNIGEGNGTGFNVNVPLNVIDCNDYDYMAIIIHILLPLAYEFKPSLILVSAGYDACLGCPEGLMRVTPSFYGHLITQLMGISYQKILVLLEGGYYIPSLVEGVKQTINALLGNPCAPLEFQPHIKSSVIDTINNVKIALKPYWDCFRKCELTCNIQNLKECDWSNQHYAVQAFYGEPDRAPFPLEVSINEVDPITCSYYKSMMKYLEEKRLKKTEVGYILNPLSEGHDVFNPRPLETEGRIDVIMAKLKEFKLLPLMKEVNLDKTASMYLQGCQKGVWQDLMEILQENHDSSYLKLLCEHCGTDKFQKSDLYSTEQTYQVCLESCARLCQMVEHIFERKMSSGFAFLRPPGHHAKRGSGGGFCHLNTVAAAAKYAVRKGSMKKVLIVDFDIHHGEGTQQLTYDTDTIFYVSMHRFDKTKFYPKDPTGSVEYTGRFPGRGYNVNVAFNGEKMEDADYIFTWIRVVLPLAYSYGPEIIIISAGFDAGINDPLGGGYKVSPETFGHLIQLIKPVAPLLLALEGGYNKETTSLSVVNCVRALLGERIPFPNLGLIKPAAATAMQNAIEVSKPRFSMMKVYKSLDLDIRTLHDLMTAEDEEAKLKTNSEKVIRVTGNTTS